MKLQDTEVRTGKKYICDYEDFKGESWDTSLLKIFNTKATYEDKFCIKLELKQRGKNKDGFYPNYLVIITDDEKCDFKVDEMLDAYGFVFNKSDIKIKCLLVEDEEDCEYIVEEW